MARPGIRLVVVMVAAMWLLEAVDVVTPRSLDGFGIVPRTASGLVGIAVAPFLHAGFGHLAMNTVGFVALGVLIALGGGAMRVVAVTATAAMVSGAAVWLLSPSPSVTVGASGVVFGYAAYLIVRGVVSRRVGQLALGAVVIAVFGGGLLAGLVPTAGISWLGHMFGALGGVLAAYLLDQRDAQSRLPGSSRKATAR